MKMFSPAKAISKLLQLILSKNRSILWRLLDLFQAVRRIFSKHKNLKPDAIEPPPDVQGRVAQRELHFNYLTKIEAEQIREQFRRADDGRRLLFWTNLPRELAQAWANANEANTLSAMMGSLWDEMKEEKMKKRSAKWSKYVKGVSCLYAEFARQKSSIIVLTTPPGVPHRREKLSTYLSLEEPILKGDVVGLEKLQIDYVHPTARSAEISEYSRWPRDSSKLWIDRFGKQECVEASALSGQIQKGKAGPHFSINRLPSMRVELPYDSLVWSQPPSQATKYNLLAIFKASGQISPYSRSKITAMFRTIARWIKAPLLLFIKAATGFYRPCLQSRASIGEPYSTVIDPSTEQPDSIVLSHQDAVVSKPVCEATVELPMEDLEQSEKQIPQLIDLSSLQTSPDASNIVQQKKGTKKKETLEAPVPTVKESTSSIRIKPPSKKELVRQLTPYMQALEIYSARKNIPMDYEFPGSRSSIAHTVVLKYNGCSFTSKSTNKKLAKYLAAKQACDQFNIP